MTRNLVISGRMVILSGVVFSAFLMRIFTAGSGVTYPDSCLYLSFAKSIWRGKSSFDFNGGVERILPPLYSISNALFTFLTGDNELSGILVSAIAGAILIIPVFYLAKAVYHEKAAWVSVVLVFLSPVLIRWSGAILTESLFITLFISAITVCWYAMERRKRTLFFSSGVLMGLSYLTRIIGLVAIPILALWIIFYSIRPDRANITGLWQWLRINYDFRRIVKDVAAPLILLALGFFLITGPYLIHLRSVYGHWTLSASYGSIEGVIATEGAATTTGWEKLTTEKTEESLFFKKLIKKAALNGWNYSMALLIMLSFAFIFIIAGLIPSWRILYLISFVIVYFAALLVLPLSPLLDERMRYLSPILPLLLIAASGGITRIQDRVKWENVKRIAISIMIGIVLLSFIPQFKIFPIQFNKFWDKNESVNIREKIGLWMKENIPHPIRVMSRKPYIPYYADAVWFTTPATYDEVIQLADAKGIDYIVIDRGVDFYRRPELSFLFNPIQAPEGLKFIGGLRHPKTGELYIGIYNIKRNSSRD